MRLPRHGDNLKFQTQLAMNKTLRNTIAAMAAAAAGAAAAQEMPKMVVGATQVKTAERAVERKYNGRVAALESVAVVPQVAGEIKAVHFREGAMVKAGDPLYTIDKVKYEAAAASARAGVAQAKANAEYAGKTYVRVKALYDKKVASDDDMDSAVSAKGAADAALAAAEAALVSAEDNLAHCSIKAPIPGRIGLNKATVGNYVATASGALTTIVRSDPVRIAFSMSARDFASVFGGEAGLKDSYIVKVTLADGTEHPGVPDFDFVENTANASTDTITAYYTLGNGDGALIPGMSVKIRIVEKKPALEVVVPTTAVIHDKAGAFVYVLDAEGVPSRRDIETGGTSHEYEFVKAGLAEGETVVSRGTHKVMPIPGTGKFAPVTPVSM